MPPLRAQKTNAVTTYVTLKPNSLRTLHVIGDRKHNIMDVAVLPVH